MGVGDQNKVSKQEDLIKLDRNIKDAESKLKTFKNNLDIVQKEVDLLSSMERKLQENIDFLKKNKTVAIAEEYKKSKENLKKTKVRLGQLKNDLSLNDKASLEIESYIKQNREAYDKLSKQGDNNVLQGKFGKRSV